MGEGTKVDNFGLHVHECTHTFTQACTCANQIENKNTNNTVCRELLAHPNEQFSALSVSPSVTGSQSSHEKREQLS